MSFIFFLKDNTKTQITQFSDHSSIFLKIAIKIAIPRKIPILCLPNERLRCTEN